MADSGARHRDELVREIGAGQVIVHAGQVYHKQQDLPREIELAAGDIRRKQHALGEIKQRRDAAQAELDAVQAELGDVGELSPDEVSAPQAENAPPELTLGRVDDLPSAGLRTRKSPASEGKP